MELEFNPPNKVVRPIIETLPAKVVVAGWIVVVARPFAKIVDMLDVETIKF